MSEPKFTPGPWKVSGAEGCRMIAINRECPQTVVADVWGKGERHEANAALIAAAPEMFNELQDICNMCKRGEFEVEPTSRRIHGICEKCTIGNITKKARGEE